MKKLILALALCIPSIAVAGPYDGYLKGDGYKDFHPEYNHADVKIEVTKLTQVQLIRLYASKTKGHGEHDPNDVRAFSVLRPDLNACTIYVTGEKDMNVYLEHEKKHCQFGRWHS